MSRLEKLKENLIHLAHFNAPLARKIMKTDKERIKRDFEFCTTEAKELNLLYKKKLNSYTFHSPQGALKEVNQFFSQFDPKCQVLYIFGVGLGYSYFQVRKWLEANPKLQVIYIEPLLPVFFHLFQTDLGKKIVEHPRVHLHHFENASELKGLLNHLTAEFCLYKAQCIASPIYLKRFPTIARYMALKIPESHDHLSTVLNESDHAQNTFFRNFSRLAPYFDALYSGSSPIGAFQNVPCIIVGAGPSLQKNIDVLKTLSEKAIILAGSSSISGLTQQGLTPHLGNYFDPYRRVYDRFLTNTAFELPTVICARTFSEVWRWVHGPRLYLKGSMATPVVNWLEDRMDLVGPQNPEAISVTSSNLFYAQLLGCNPIIFVGVDLAYTNNQSYMSGVSKNIDEDKEIEEESTEFQFNADQMSVDIDGNPIKTRAGWLAESKIIAMQARQTPTLNIINATEGGLGFQGVSNLPLKQVKDWFLKRDYPIDQMMHNMISRLSPPKEGVSKKAVSDLKRIKKSLDRCSKYYLETIKVLKKMLKDNKAEKLDHIEVGFLTETMGKVSQEIAYQYLLKRYHQLTDIRKLKNQHLNRQLSINAPKVLSQEINISDMISRFIQYQETCDEHRVTLAHALKQIKDDPW